MATIYTVLSTITFKNKEHKSICNPITDVDKTFSSKDDALEHLKFKIDCYQHRLERHRLNHIRMDRNSVEVILYDEDETYNITSWTIFESELQ